MYAKNTWEKYKDQLNEVFDYNEGYKHYISKNKTERACVKDSIKLAEEKGFKPLESFDTLKSGDKVYVTNRGKNIALFIIGKKPLTEGMRILGASAPGCPPGSSPGRSDTAAQGYSTAGSCPFPAKTASQRPPPGRRPRRHRPPFRPLQTCRSSSLSFFTILYHFFSKRVSLFLTN